MSLDEENFDTLLHETRKFPPHPSFRQQATVSSADLYHQAAANGEAFWAEQARELTWSKPFTEILAWDPPHARWFYDGELNAATNTVDRHRQGATKNKVALIWEGEPGDQVVLTYDMLGREVDRAAQMLTALGVQPDDRITLYLPMIPELVIAMLAAAKVGAIHSIVFGGFSAEALRERINDAGSRLVITADAGWRRGKTVPLKANTDAALTGCPQVEQVVVVERVGQIAGLNMIPGRDRWWHQAMAEASTAPFAPVPRHAEDILFTLYTSGTTGKPKGIVHSTAGYLTGANTSCRLVFDLKPEDVYFCTADIGWITGHTYVVYGPLSCGATVVMYEGAPDWPDRDRYWALIERYGVTVLYTAPTSIRTFMKWGPELPGRHRLDSLRLLGTVGEPINPEAWMWYYEVIGGARCPIVDTWWQTETGAAMISPLPGVTDLKPGSASVPVPGIFADVVDTHGHSVPPGGAGYLVLTRPWPSMLRTIWGDDQRYQDTYWNRFPGRYFTGDGAHRDEDGYYWILGRVDDVMNISGHRIGTMEVESALVDDHRVAESAVIGRQHDLKGQAISAFVTLKDGIEGTPELVTALKQHVADKIGPMARPEEIFFTAELPKTRSGKIMRRLLRDVAEGRALGDTTTLADPTVVEALKQQYEAQDPD
ncbi:MAG: acetate--CoA ligase [Firmicutes bacterium]|jgi:acetyl-CoA synthetase|nr:acetate--CoA ligase [Bacillota bacterium]MCL5064729.1 acetate--CoA ligase [Bacillota bacterium]